MKFKVLLGERSVIFSNTTILLIKGEESVYFNKRGEDNVI
jgi:hypothetical protein